MRFEYENEMCDTFFLITRYLCYLEMNGLNGLNKKNVDTRLA